MKIAIKLTVVSGLCLQLATGPAQADNFEVMVAPVVPFKRYGAPSLVELNGGNILLAYNEWTELGDISDFSPAEIKARISEDGGRTWNRPFILQENTSKKGRMDPPSLLRLQNGEIALFYEEVNSYTEVIAFVRKSSNEGQTWSAPIRINRTLHGGLDTMNHRAIQLRTGRLLMPFGYMPDYREQATVPEEALVFYSDDDGRSWIQGTGRVRVPKHPSESRRRIGAQEPGLVELNDGSVMMIVRTAHERIFRSISRDGGDTWTNAEPIEQLVAPVAPATIMRIPQTRDLAMVWNYSPKVRTPLAIAVSRDEGKTWKNIRYLETDYQSYAYTAFLFPRESNRLLLCYWVHDPKTQGIGLKIRGIDLDWIYSAE